VNRLAVARNRLWAGDSRSSLCRANHKLDAVIVRRRLRPPIPPRPPRPPSFPPAGLRIVCNWPDSPTRPARASWSRAAEGRSRACKGQVEDPWPTATPVTIIFPAATPTCPACPACPHCRDPIDVLRNQATFGREDIYGRGRPAKLRARHRTSCRHPRPIQLSNSPPRPCGRGRID